MKKELNNFQVVWRMMKLVKPLILPMCLAIIMGAVSYTHLGGTVITYGIVSASLLGVIRYVIALLW